MKLLMENQQKRKRANCIRLTEKRRTDSIPEGADLGGATEGIRADGNWETFDEQTDRSFEDAGGRNTAEIRYTIARRATAS